MDIDFAAGFKILGVFALIILVAVFLTTRGCSKSSGYKEGYRQGQIDALTGNVKYKLITLTDSTKKWVEYGKAN